MPAEIRPSSRVRSRNSSKRKALTIGEVTKMLSSEFDDISISKIRYLEDQKLLSPRRTEGGYRLYSRSDVDRLRSILRMQRDEFLPLRVIRKELAGGARRRRRPAGSGSTTTTVSGTPRETMTLEEMIEETGVTAEQAAELADHGLLSPVRGPVGEALYDEADVDIARACVELARFGVHGRNLRVFRTSADRESALLEQLIGPSLRSHDSARRREALDNLENLASVTGHLKHLLLVKDLRRVTGES